MCDMEQIKWNLIPIVLHVWWNERCQAFSITEPQWSVGSSLIYAGICKLTYPWFMSSRILCYVSFNVSTSVTFLGDGQPWGLWQSHLYTENLDDNPGNSDMDFVIRVGMELWECRQFWHFFVYIKMPIHLSVVSHWLVHNMWFSINDQLAYPPLCGITLTGALHVILNQRSTK